MYIVSKENMAVIPAENVTIEFIPKKNGERWEMWAYGLAVPEGSMQLGVFWDVEKAERVLDRYIESLQHGSIIFECPFNEEEYRGMF